ncbi:hypothetical protein KAW38_04215 [Candidatus Micrarchaeota archaeon]|nr:hypothetical protein [Candidatus Micrarchaeota archaeon]
MKIHTSKKKTAPIQVKKRDFRVVEFYLNGNHFFGSFLNDLSFEGEDPIHISKRIEKAKKEGMIVYSLT